MVHSQVRILVFFDGNIPVEPNKLDFQHVTPSIPSQFDVCPPHKRPTSSHLVPTDATMPPFPPQPDYMKTKDTTLVNIAAPMEKGKGKRGDRVRPNYFDNWLHDCHVKYDKMMTFEGLLSRSKHAAKG